VGRFSALIAVGCVGLIAAGTLTDASFARLLQVSAVLFFIGAVISGLSITNPAVPAELSSVPAKSPSRATTVTTPARS
jgi:hypothetical protein